jgi:DNA invertase Pin-like site-specific DNA recombinase
MIFKLLERRREMTEIPNQFEELIKNSGLKKKAIAQHMGMSRSNFYKKQKKPRKAFSSEEVEKLSVILDVPVETVFDAVLKTKVS